MGLTCGFHLTAKVVSFGRGQSAVHTAAYNSRTQLFQEREGRSTKDYSKLEDEVLFSGIFAPDGAPDWTRDRQQLWNRAEAAERQKVNGQPARNMIAAFPHELNQQQREWMLKDFAREQFARRGMIADVAMHAPDREGDQRNYHAHILLTMRKLDGDNFAKTKAREWNSTEALEGWREAWAEKGARALERAGYPVEAERWRHGHETLGKQRVAALERGDTAFADNIEREATMHKGAKATSMERRGIDSERLDRFNGIVERNDIRVEMKALDGELMELRRLDDQEKAQAIKVEEQARQSSAAKEPPEPPRAAAQEAQAVAASPTQAEPQKRTTGENLAEKEAFVGGPSPGDEIKPVQAGLRVVDSAAGTVTKLGDFMLDFLSGSPPPPEQKADMRGFVTDPAARKEQQLARLAASKTAQAADKALESIAEDMKAGRNLKSEDIKKLTRQHQEQIFQFGDSAVRQMVDEAQKRAEQYWKGNSRERERD